MSSLAHLLENNRAWAARVEAEDPGFFSRLGQQQSPRYLWIGCSDSRVPSNQLIGLMPGEVFVHRNIGNVVAHTDLNCLSVVEFAVNLLQVKDIILCGHYGCSGVRAAMQDSKLGLSTNWLRNIQDVFRRHRQLLSEIQDPLQQADRFCELNAMEQVINLCQTTIVRDAWERGQDLTVHAWVYGVGDGLMRDLKMSINSAEAVDRAHQAAVDELTIRCGIVGAGAGLP